jgi:hypothetical protein
MFGLTQHKVSVNTALALMGVSIAPSKQESEIEQNEPPVFSQRRALTISSPFDVSTLDGMNGFRIDGISAWQYSGFSVSSAGDVNKDGFGKYDERGKSRSEWSTIGERP